MHKYFQFFNSFLSFSTSKLEYDISFYICVILKIPRVQCLTTNDHQCEKYASPRSTWLQLYPFNQNQR